MLQVTLILVIIIQIKSSPINNRQLVRNVWYPKFLAIRESPDTPLERRRHIRAVIDPIVDTEDSTNDSSADEEPLETAAQRYYYYPYYRVRKISARSYNNPPLSNYADNYDKFPTVA